MRLRIHTRDRGAVIPIVALTLGVLVLSTAFAIDLGSQRADRRDMQAIADVVSLDLSRRLEGRDAVTIDDDASFGDAIVASTSRNDHPITVSAAPWTVPDEPCPAGTVPATCLTVTLGTWDDAAYAFTPCPDIGQVARSACFPDSVQVEAGDVTDYRFQPGSGSVRRPATARVGDAARARFQVGSSLLAINPQTDSIVGQLLNSIAPGASVLSYSGLADATLSLDELGIPLGVPITAASPDELLNTMVGLDELTVAAATALQNSGGDPADVALLNDFAALGVDNAQVSLGEVLGVNAPGGSAGAGATANVAQMLLTSVFLANGTHAVSLPGTTLNVPGIADIGLTLTGVEAPQQGGNADGASVTTRQIGLQLTPTIDIDTADIAQDVCSLPSDEQDLINGLLGGVLNLLGCTLAIILPPAAQLLSVQIQGNPTIDLAVAEVTVSQSIDCTNEQLTLTPSPATINLQTDVDLNISATLGGASLPDIAALSLTAGAYSPGVASPQTFAGLNPTALPTGQRWDQFNPPQARVGSTPLGLSNLLQANASTLSVLDLDLAVLSNVVLGIIQPVINTLLGQLDTLLLQPLTQLLGIHLGGADLVPLWMECDESAVSLVG